MEDDDQYERILAQVAREHAASQRPIRVGTALRPCGHPLPATETLDTLCAHCFDYQQAHALHAALPAA